MKEDVLIKIRQDTAHSTRTAFGIRQHLKQLAKFSLSLALGSTRLDYYCCCCCFHWPLWSTNAFFVYFL